MSSDTRSHMTDPDADWADVAMAAIAATVLLGMPALFLLFR
jgi:hypothetical protein